MSKFENKLCPVCRAPFNKNADIVVCPVCGTPHHRLCYLSKNRCGVEEFHAQGFVWNGYLPDEEISEPEPQNTDPHHSEYPSGASNSAPDVGTQQSAPQYGELESMEDVSEYYDSFCKSLNDDTCGEDGVSLHELCVFASKSVFHYGRAFGLFRGSKKSKIFMNLCSGIFAPVYQFYRKMDLLGIGVLLFTLATSLPTLLVYTGIIDYTEGISSTLYSINALCNFLSFILTVVLCLFGDYFYYRHAVKKIKKIRRRFEGNCGSEYYEALQESGKPSWLRAVIGFLAMMLIMACITVFPKLMMQ